MDVHFSVDLEEGSECWHGPADADGGLADAGGLVNSWVLLSWVSFIVLSPSEAGKGEIFGNFEKKIYGCARVGVYLRLFSATVTLCPAPAGQSRR